MWNIPLLRSGRAYESMNTITIEDFRTGEPLATVSQANPGLIAKDIRHTNRDMFHYFSAADMLEICKRAAFHFLHSDLPVGPTAQSPAAGIPGIQPLLRGLPRIFLRHHAQPSLIKT